MLEHKESTSEPVKQRDLSRDIEELADHLINNNYSAEEQSRILSGTRLRLIQRKEELSKEAKEKLDFHNREIELLSEHK